MQFRPNNFLQLIIGVQIGLICISCTYDGNLINHHNNPELVKAIRSSAEYLQKNLNDNGKFIYIINMNPHVEVKESYNILRHAGTVYSMTQYASSFHDDEIIPSIQRAGGFLKSSINPVPGFKNMLAVWSTPDINNRIGLTQAKLGGTGLGLIALVGIEKITPGFTPIDKLREMGSFLIFMQKEDGSFYSTYIPNNNRHKQGFNSIYYPGEAALGLLMLNEIDPSEIWSESALKVLYYLASNENINRTVVDHWTLLATEFLFNSKNISRQKYDRQLLLDNASRIVKMIIKQQVTATVNSEIDGGFTLDGRTTPTSTRLEGLIASLNIIDDPELRDKIESSIKSGMRFLLNSQIKSGPYTGAFPGSAYKIPLDTPVVTRLNRRATEVRIDYVQHALSAMVQYYEYMSGN